MKRIGLTGSIAAGKSTVSKRLQELGAYVIDADAVSRELSEKGSPVLHEIQSAFGDGVIAPDGALDRALLSRIVFADEAQRKKLEAILHPAIKRRMREMEDAQAGAERVVYDVPLLFESGMDAQMDEIWVVDAPRETRIRRLEERNGLDREQAERRIRAQMPDEEKRRRADVLIENDGTIEELIRKVDDLWQNTEKSY